MHNISQGETHKSCYRFNWLEKIKYVFALIVIRVFGSIVKKDNNLWLFGGNKGDSYGDNSAYFYEYVNNKSAGIRPVWIANNDYTVRYVRSFGGEAYRVLSWKHIACTLKARVYVTSHFIDSDLRIYDDRKTVFINLWHGMPIKKIVYDAQTSENEETVFTRIHRFIRSSLLGYKDARALGDLIPATSDYTKEFLAQAFRSKNVEITGLPRGDIMYNMIGGGFPYSIKTNPQQRLILYMPTHRRWGKAPTRNIFTNSQFLERLNECCKRNNFIFAVKLHPNEKDSIGNIRSDYVINITKENIDSQKLLVEADILITDYSSCFIDYALLKRPMIFFAYDLSDYIENDMGLYIDYEKDVPGPIVTNENDLLRIIEIYISDDTNLHYLNQYGIKLSKYHKYFDNHSMDRIYEKIQDCIYR